MIRKLSGSFHVYTHTKVCLLYTIIQQQNHHYHNSFLLYSIFESCRFSIINTVSLYTLALWQLADYPFNVQYRVHLLTHATYNRSYRNPFLYHPHTTLFYNISVALSMPPATLSLLLSNTIASYSFKKKSTVLLLLCIYTSC